MAGASKVNSPVYDFLLLCCRYNPLQGKYGVLIFNLMRASGCLMVLLRGGLRQPFALDGVGGKSASRELAPMNFALLPYEDSSYATSVDAIFLSLLLLCSAITLAVFAVIIFFCIRYRKGSGADRTHYPSEAEAAIGIELTWTVIPFIIFRRTLYLGGKCLLRNV